MMEGGVTATIVTTSGTRARAERRWRILALAVVGGSFLCLALSMLLLERVFATVIGVEQDRAKLEAAHTQQIRNQARILVEQERTLELIHRANKQLQMMIGEE